MLIYDFFFRWLQRGKKHIGNHDLILFRRKLDIMKRHEVRTFKFIG